MRDVKPKSAVERRFGWLLGALMLAGFVVRLAYVFMQSRADPWFAFPTGDGAAYLDWARERLAGVPAPADAFESPPLYPFALTGFVRIFGENLGLLYYLQHVLTVAAAGALGLAGRRWIGAGAGLAACAVFLLYGPHQFFASRPLGEPLAVALLCAGMLAWTKPSRAGAGAAGLLLGLATVARPNLLPAAPLWAAAETRRRPWRAALLLVGLLLALAPSTVRNYVASGHFVPVSSNAGLTLYHGNGPSATGAISIAPELAQTGKGDQRRIATWLARERTGQPFDPVEADRWWGAEALRARLADPTGTLGLLSKRVLLLLWSSELTLDGGPRQDANPLRWAAPLPFGLILGLAAAGLAALGWRGTGGWPVWSTVLACAVAPVVFYVSSRYRLPFASVLCLPAGAGLAALLRPPAESTPRRRTVVWLVLVGITGLSMVPVAGGMLARADAAGLVQRGIAWTRTGHVERAEADFRSAVEHFEQWAPAHFYLAELLDRNGRGSEAEVIYRRALELQPDYANAACYLGQMLSLGGRPDEALPLLRQGLESHPFHEVCWHHLVGALALTGKASEAAGEVARAADLGVELDPRLVEAVKAMATSPPDDAGAGSEKGSAGDTDEQE